MTDMRSNNFETKSSKFSILSKGFIAESCSSDIEMWRRIGSRYNIGHIAEATVYYHSNKDSYGAQSLVTRSVEEIIKDWEILRDKVMSYYPEDVRASKEKQVAQVAKSQLVNGLSAVIIANIKAKQYKNAFRTVRIVIFRYGGFFQLVKVFFGYFIQRFKKLFSN